MTDEFSPELQRELLDDFYTECDELFGHIRTELVTVEQRGVESVASRTALESVYRDIHTIKGNCGIVGLRPAEALAHAVEDVLRNVSRGKLTITMSAIELVTRGVQQLEQLVATHRAGQPLPSTEELLEQLASGDLGQVTPSSSLLDSTSPAEGRAWQATFSPSAERDQRGVNITTVRQRLAAIATITSAAPVIRVGGTMLFEFSLELLGAPPTDLAAWEADGIVLRPSATTLLAHATAVASESPSELLSLAPSHLVRVDLGRLDELMRITGELVIHRSRLEERIAQVSGDRSGLLEVSLALTRSLRDLRGAITRARLVPIAEIFNRLPFAVRDLVRESGKKVRLAVEGQDTEIDKYVVERLKEPLLHLVRNALSHGVESPDVRTAAGKPAEATLLLHASAAGHSVTIRIRDDGAGIDREAILARASELGLPVVDGSSDSDVLAILCHAGFSTRKEATLAAGRGVGMSVVQTTVRELGGTLALESEPGRWTCFTLRLPLTLSIADTFIVSAGAQTCAVPQSFIEQIIQVDESEVRKIKQVEVVPYRDGLLPVVRLTRILGVASERRALLPVLVVTSERGSAGLVVDRVHAQREVVVRPLHDPLVRVSGISGATELGDGRPVLILDPAALTNGVVRPRDRSAMSPLPASSAA